MSSEARRKANKKWRAKNPEKMKINWWRWYESPQGEAYYKRKEEERLRRRDEQTL